MTWGGVTFVIQKTFSSFWMTFCTCQIHLRFGFPLKK